MTPYDAWDGGSPRSQGSTSQTESRNFASIDRQLVRLEDEEYSLRGRIRTLEDTMEDVDASVRTVADRAYAGEDMGLDAWGVDKIQRLRASILAHCDEQRELSYQRLRTIDHERETLYDQRRTAYLRECP